MLFFEAILLGLSTPVMITVEDVDRGLALWLGLGLAVACIVVAGMLRRPGGFALGHALQVATIALGLLAQHDALTAREAARLAAILPSPRRYSASSPGPYVRRRTARIQAAMGTVREQGLAACVTG